MPAGENHIPVKDRHSAPTCIVRTDEPWPPAAKMALAPINGNGGFNGPDFTTQRYGVDQDQIALVDIDQNLFRPVPPIIEVSRHRLTGLKVALALQPPHVQRPEVVREVLGHGASNVCTEINWKVDVVTAYRLAI